MTGDLFSRALENADSITAEELKLTSLEKSEGETKLQNMDKEGIENIGDSNVNETANGKDNDSQLNNDKVKEQSNEGDTIIEGTVQKSTTSDNDGGNSTDDSNASSSEDDSPSSESSNSDTSSLEEEEENMEDDKEVYEEGVEEEEEEGHNLNEPIRSKNEIVEEQIIEVPENYKIDDKTKISEIGIIKSVFESNVIVQGTISGEKRVLKEGSIFCLENREVVGTLSEVFGQLQNPFYKVGISPVNETKSELIEKIKEMVGEKIFIVVPDAYWIDTFELKRVKGTDASNGYDEELPEEEQEFSDDEKEAQFKRMMKNKKKKKKTSSEMNNHGNNKINDHVNNNNKIMKKKQYANYKESNAYSKMKVPVGMVQQKHYTSRVNRNKDMNTDSNTYALDINNTNISSKVTLNNNINDNNSGLGHHNNSVFANVSRGTYQSTANYYGHMTQQSQYNINNFNGNYQHSFTQNLNQYPQQQYNNGNFNVPYGGMHTQGYVNANYPNQPYGYNPNYNMQYNYANHNTQIYSQQATFPQQSPYSQNSNIYYQQNLQQAHPPQYQQQILPPTSNLTNTSDMEQVRKFHEMLLQQKSNENGNNLSTQKTDKQNNLDNDIPY